jgi:isopropylmalate/homocitrate/citramalate synthase
MSIVDKIIKNRTYFKSYFSNFNKILGIKIFDVTLRDGLQSIPLNEEPNFTFENKLKLLNHINEEYSPNDIELGSIVSPKILPILKDSMKLYDYHSQNYNNGYILIPSKNRLKTGINNGVTNFSFITSVSNSFQEINTKRSVEQNKNELIEMMYEIFSNEKIINPSIKLYISCINNCPIEGKICYTKILSEIKFYQERVKPDIICLSDTCGTLEEEDFINIIEGCYYSNIDLNKISLHLHVKNEENVKKLIHIALKNNIKMFDISLLNTGGCSVTMGREYINKNLTYELFYEAIFEYLINQKN